MEGFSPLEANFVVELQTDALLGYHELLPCGSGGHKNESFNKMEKIEEEDVEEVEEEDEEQKRELVLKDTTPNQMLPVSQCTSPKSSSPAEIHPPPLVLQLSGSFLAKLLKYVMQIFSQWPSKLISMQHYHQY